MQWPVVHIRVAYDLWHRRQSTHCTISAYPPVEHELEAKNQSSAASTATQQFKLQALHGLKLFERYGHS